MINIAKTAFLQLSFLLLFHLGYSQTVIQGKVTDESTGDVLTGVNISVQNKLIGTITDKNGVYELKTQIDPPFTLVFSSIGYKPQTVEISTENATHNVQLEEELIIGEEIIITGSHVEEEILNATVTTEKLDLMDIRQTSAANFFDGLYKLKGVDMIVQSLNFRFPNARGFNGENNFRMNQLVDGIDNHAPGLSFAAGNIFGLSQLDIESVEFIVGASSALYGPGGMNGTLLMTSKNPFDYQGLSAMVQTGMMHAGADYRDQPAPMTDINIRYAKSFNNKLALKITGGYLKALDWHGADYRDRTNLNDPDLNRMTNPAYDGVNVYGDEVIVPVNLQDVAPDVADGVARSQGYEPGEPEYESIYNMVVSKLPDQVISRTGWKEQDLVDYNTKNIRGNVSLHYRINDNLEAIMQGGMGNATAVYTAQNRFSLSDFSMTNAKLELKSPLFYLRTFGVWESSGDTYDAGGAALQLNEAWKSSEDWYADYIQSFTQAVLTQNTEEEAHEFARLVADNRDVRTGAILDNSKPAYPMPGTEQFNTLFNDIISRPITDGGAKVIDKSKKYAVEGMYNFARHINLFGLVVGGSFRRYLINSEGTVFIDEPGNPVSVNEYGAFAQITKSILGETILLVASGRYDKNENFEGRFTPRCSFTYSFGEEKLHKLRGSWQTAFRFPAIPDQFVDIQVGPFRSLGGLPEVQERYNFSTNPVYPLEGRNALDSEPVLDDGPFDVPSFGPEQVTAFEVGYRGMYLGKHLFVDGYIFQNVYKGFLANQLLVQNPGTPEESRYQTTISTDEPITAYGWALGADYKVGMGFIIDGNLSYNGIESVEDRSGFETRFNTPDYRLNLGISNREVYRNLGFSINWRWQNDFIWQSSFGNGNIPAFSILDAQVSYQLKDFNTIVKLGGSNVLNDYYTTSFGSAHVGGLYYLTLYFDQFMN